MADPVINPLARAQGIASILKEQGVFAPTELTREDIIKQREMIRGLPGLGPVDYDAQLDKSREDAKLQFYLQMAQRGFAAAGAAPRRNESPVSTLSRELFSPLAGDASKLAAQFTKQKQAQRIAKRADEARLSQAALTMGQQQLSKKDAADAQLLALGKTLADRKYTPVTNTMRKVDGKWIDFRGWTYIDRSGSVPIPRTVAFNPDGTEEIVPSGQLRVYRKPAATDYNLNKVQNVSATLNLDGKEVVIPSANLSVQVSKSNPAKQIIATIGQIRLEDGRVVPAGSKVLSYKKKPDGPSTTVTRNLFGQVYDKASNTFRTVNNVTRMTDIVENPAGGSSTLKDSYSAQGPGGKRFTVSGFVENTASHGPFVQSEPLYIVDSKEAARVLGLKEDSVRPGDVISTFRRPAITATGATEDVIQRRFKGVRIKALPKEFIGSPAVQTRPLTEKQTRVAGQTSPKYEKIGKLTVTSETANLISGSVAGDEAVIERNQDGDVRYIYKGETLSKKVARQLQASPLSETQKVAARQVTESRNSYVNTGKNTVEVAGQSIGPGQTGHFSKTDLSTNEFLNAAGDFKNAGPVSIDSKAYMFIGFDPQKIGEVEYAPGDEIRLTRQQLENLKPELQKALSADTQLRSNTIKSNFLRSLWGNVVTNNAASLKQGGIDTKKLLPSEKQLQSLLAMFPAGMRSGGDKLQDKIFEMIKLDATANQDGQPTDQSATALKKNQNYADSVAKRLDSAKTRYDSYKKTGFLPSEQPWESLGYEDKVAFANLQDVLQPKNVQGLWDNAKDRLAKAKKDYAPVSTDDIASFSAATELLILAKYLKQSQDVSKSGVFTGSLRKFGVDKFADVEPLTSGASKRLLTIINRMKASYGTLTEKGGRDSVFKQQLQAGLIPAFDTSESMNLSNLSSIINRLETNIRSSLTNETLATNVVPKSFEIMAKEAGITGVDVDQRRYPWIDPNKPDIVPVTRQKTMDAINLEPFSIEDARDLTVGRLLPPDSETPNVRYIKIRNLSDNEVLIQQADRTGKPLPKAPKRILQMDLGTRLQRSKVQ